MESTPEPRGLHTERLSEEAARAVVDAAGGLPTLDHVCRWAYGRGLEIHDAVAMDEFTFDVIVPVAEGLVLVFDTT